MWDYFFSLLYVVVNQKSNNAKNIFDEFKKKNQLTVGQN